MANSNALQKRLLHDIAELQTQPYPNIHLFVDDADLTRACLVLTPAGWLPLHLTVQFHDQYPLSPPVIEMNSSISHPHVFGNYICASILNTTEGYTPAYTLKGIAIQLLSFFGSDSLENEDGYTTDLRSYKKGAQHNRLYECEHCEFHNDSSLSPPSSAPLTDFIVSPSARSEFLNASVVKTPQPKPTKVDKNAFFIDELPNEIILHIAEGLEFEDLTKFAQAWDRVSNVIVEFDVARVRELQCFVLKQSFHRQKLGVGVSIAGTGRQGTVQSEFDLLSSQAFTNLHVRHSIHGISFSNWLPLPISFGHWQRVKGDVNDALVSIAKAANIGKPAMVIYAFMTDVMVRLNSDLERQEQRTSNNAKSTLRHASEKAIESYFHLFHILLCIATGEAGRRYGIVEDANRMIKSFMSGKTTKADIPNLGYLLISLLISEVVPTEALMKAIVTEAITRNVVWLLDGKGAGFAELGYLESDPVSQYRLKRTFEGSRTSYRLLMFSELFRRTARPITPPTLTQTPLPPSPPPKQHHAYSTIVAALKPSRKATTARTTTTTTPPPPTNPNSLPALCTTLFRRHGAPPPGTAAYLASEVRRLQQIADFPSFLREMGITIPSASKFTTVLRSTVTASAARGYSRSLTGPRDIADLASLRVDRDRSVDRKAIEARVEALGLKMPSSTQVEYAVEWGKLSFFPGGRSRGAGGQGQGQSQRGGGRGGGGGRGRGRGGLTG
ncbi:hypothetical protein B0T25DRAFT_548524 [Lasiosphaeria hispida]|uniref:UBC core domain-containing protein n=1 Tax=Lasiosphaeria hispida TaxID=260671 RepID=A0AAJ0HEY2_9PEZI|nr:hypothetical protein B0T25DRAFT_548524 [Lasiosphaeria hispida]